MSSGGALIVSGNEICVGARVEVSMEWPSLLDERIPLRQFRTMRSMVQPISPSIGDRLEKSLKKAASA
jgi:hypothetical protein